MYSKGREEQQNMIELFLVTSARENWTMTSYQHIIIKIICYFRRDRVHFESVNIARANTKRWEKWYDQDYKAIESF